MKRQDNEYAASLRDVELSDEELAPIAAGDATDLTIAPTLDRATRFPITDLTFKDPAVVLRPVTPEVGGLNRGFPRPNVSPGDGPSVVVTWSKSF